MLTAAEMLGESRQVVALRERIARFLERSRDGQRLPPIVIEGENGTGKGLLAKTLHQHSPRRDGPFVDVNCAALPEALLESEMFGYERGAFSEARQPKAGLLEAASGGTIFLDEVALLPLPLQAKLLKAIEDLSVRRLGSTQSRPVDVWVISATNANLTAAVKEHRFREDLYHRLAVVSLRVPPLRERGDDIVLLARHFLDRACAYYKLPRMTLADDARAALLRHPWSGNVRELSNVMDRTALDAESAVVTAPLLRLPEADADASPVMSDREFREEVGEAERKRLLAALEQTGWNLSRAAALLHVPRNTLRYRMEKLGISVARASSPVRSEPATAPPPSPSDHEGHRWELRRVALLRALIASPSDGDLAVDGGRVLDALVDKIEVFEGRVEEAGPTGLVASFGAEPKEDITARAAHAALALRRAAAQATESSGPAWTLRVAVHTGQFLVARGRGGTEIALDARRQASALLDTLVERAEPGGIVASGDAAQFLTRRFVLAPLAEEGGTGAAFRIVGREQPGAATARHVAAFVGRSRNMDLLESCLSATLDGRGQAVGIAGELGIGKSRLIAEFRERLGGEPITYREGTCLSYGAAIPYVPLLDILRQNFGIAETDSAAIVRDKIGRRLALVGMDDTSAPYLLHLLGITEGVEGIAALTAEAIKQRTVDTLRRMLLNAAHQRPVVVVVEDLHWIDRTSEEVLTSLVDSLPGAPILFLATYRPGYRPPWLDRSYATQMALLPLSAEDSLEVVRSILGSAAPDSLVQRILDKAEGNPFFLEELCRAVDDQRVAPGDLAVPDTIEDVLVTRIQRLPSGARRLLETASVLGREVSQRLLGAMWDGAEALEPPLASLIAAELLYPRSADGESVYVFKHALVQDITYASLATARRHALHAAAGRALERFYEGRLQEVYDRLAYHYARTEETAKAIEWLTRFADKSARAHAHDEAVKALIQALDQAERLPEETRDRKILELTLRLPQSLLPLGRIDEIPSTLSREHGRLERVQDPALSAHYYFLLGRALILGRHELAVANARKAIAAAERCGDKATMGKAFGLLALVGALSGRPAPGIEDGRRAVALLEDTTEQSSLSYAYWALGLCCSQTGAFDGALFAETRALSIAGAIGDQPQEASAGWAIGVIHAAMGNWEAGIAQCQLAVEKARDALNRAITTGVLGFAYLEQGDTARAVEAFERSIPSLRQFGFHAFEGWFTALLADAVRIEGRLDDAQALCHEALRIGTAADFGVATGWAQQTLGRIAYERADLGEAAEKLDAALAIFTAIEARYQQGRTCLDLATVWWARGDRPTARRYLSEAHDLFTRLGVPRYRERAERLAAEWGETISEAGHP